MAQACMTRFVLVITGSRDAELLRAHVSMFSSWRVMLRRGSCEAFLAASMVR